MARKQEFDILVGVVTSAFGVKGDVRVRLETDFPEGLAEKGDIRLCSPDGLVIARRIESVRLLPVTRDTAAVKLEGCDTRDDALALRGWELRILPSQLAELPKDRFYIHDLVGLEVVTTDGRGLGKITEVMRQPGNDVFVTQTVLIPALKSVVVEVDVAGGKMVIRPVAGLLD